MEAKQVTEVKHNGTVAYNSYLWLIIHTCEDKNEESKDTFLLMRSL